MNRLLSAQLLRFVAANFLAAIVNVISRLTSSQVMPDALAVVVGFCAGLSTSYFLCREFVFQSIRRPSLPEALRFTTINVAALFLTIFVYRLSARWLFSSPMGGLPEQNLRTIAHAIGVASPVLFSFAAQKTFTFKQRFESHET